jgi:GNAT superfamily N-acetyltransferase
MQREERLTARRLVIDDLKPAAEALARAFYDDPLFAWILEDDDRRLRAEQVLFEALIGRSLKIDFHEGYTTPDVAGVALWGRPGKWKLPTSVMLPSLPRLIRAMGLGPAMRFTKVMTTVEKKHPHDEPHWYLACLGTDPPKQRSGVGKTLLAPVLARCDDERVGAYLETQKPDNVPYYQQLGFQVVEEYDVAGPGTPHIWNMWRDPM